MMGDPSRTPPDARRLIWILESGYLHPRAERTETIMPSDDLLLSLLWVVPLVGSLITLALPTRAEAVIKGFALGVTLVTAIVGGLAFAAYTGATTKGRGRRPHGRAGRAEPASRRCRPTPDRPTPRPGDLVVRHHWIAPFNIQYFLGLDGISLALILLTGLVSTLSCLASFSIDKQVKGILLAVPPAQSPA
jgi:NADH-quinone oxidoreductase subunit M